MSEPILTAEAWTLVVEPTTTPVLIEGGEEYVVTLELPETVLVAAGEQGPPGPKGIPGPAGGSAVDCQAGEVISALRVLYEFNGQVFVLDYRDDAHIDLLLGISLTAADVGQPLSVQRSGVIEDAGWNLQPGRIWLGANGQLTQTPPVNGFDVLIGAAVSATRITLNIQDPIEQE
ncbi:hypothetical protein NG726_11490 [Pseudomonas sp. MOB-449]|nr:hypothetical protein [Pseudomonas sp. MOB-449]